MKVFFSIKSWWHVLLHLVTVAVLAAVITAVFFYVYLPYTTNHNETITVPNVIGIHYDDLNDFLVERELPYIITEDSAYSPDYPPLTVLKQFPLPFSKVKENRKIYLSLNSNQPPLIRMPKLVEGSVKNAQLVLKTYDLKLGKITYVPDLALNYILEQRYNEREVLEGEFIPKGSKIDLVVGDGLGRQNLESPNLTGLDLESAEFAIIGSGLIVGRITYSEEGIALVEEENDDGEIEIVERQVAPEAVFKQDPPPGQQIRLKTPIHIWIYRPNALNTEPTLLDN